MNKKLVEPKITIITYTKAKKLYKYPSARKAKIFANSEAKELEDRGILMKLRVEYGKAMTKQGKIEMFDNEITTSNAKDFRLGLKAFLDKDLWLVK